MRKIGFIGLGVMGIHIAQNLIDKGYPLKIWNRSKEKYGKLRGVNIEYTETARDIAVETDVVFYSLADNEAIVQVVFGENGLYRGVIKGQIVINLSTVDIAMSNFEYKEFLKKEVDYLDAPVFGSEDEAKAAELCIMVGGKKEIYEKVTDLLKCICKSSYYMGDNGKGAAMGLVGSLIVGLQTQAAAEAIVLAQKSGIDLKTVFEIIEKSDFKSPIINIIGKNFIENNFQPVFSLKHLKKDSDSILSLVNKLNISLPCSSVVNDNLKIAISYGLGNENFSSLVKLLQKQNNLE